MSGICCQRCLKAPCVCDTAPQPPPGDNRLRICTYCDQRSRAYAWKDHHCPNCGCFAGENDPWVLLDRIAALEATIEADRTRIIDGVNALERVVNGKFWLTEGRGSYEWNDDRYREEFGEAVRSMLKAVEPLRKIGADLTNCPQTTAEVIKAREDKDAKIAALEAELAEARERLAMAVEALEKIHKGACLTAQESRSRDDDRYCIGDVIQVASKALAATAEAVAQHTAGVERRGAAKQIKRLLDTYNGDATRTWLAGEYLRIRDGVSDNPLARVWVQRVSDGHWLGHCDTGWISEKPEVAGRCVAGAANRAIKQMRMKLNEIRLVEGEPAGAHRRREAELEGA